MRKGIPILLIGVAVASPASSASAAGFEGRCQAHGRATYERGVGLIPTATTWRFAAPGTCTGSLDGRPVAAAVRVRIRFADTAAGCASGAGHGSVRVRFLGTGTRLRLREEHPLGPVGTANGSAVAIFTAFTSLAEQDPASAAACTSGALRTFAADWSLITTKPIEV